MTRPKVIRAVTYVARDIPKYGQKTDLLHSEPAPAISGPALTISGPRRVTPTLTMANSLKFGMQVWLAMEMAVARLEVNLYGQPHLHAKFQTSSHPHPEPMGFNCSVSSQWKWLELNLLAQ